MRSSPERRSPRKILTRVSLAVSIIGLGITAFAILDEAKKIQEIAQYAQSSDNVQNTKDPIGDLNDGLTNDQKFTTGGLTIMILAGSAAAYSQFGRRRRK